MIMSEKLLTIKVQSVREETTVVGGNVDRNLVLVNARPELKQSDRIVAVNDDQWTNTEDLVRLLQKHGAAPFELKVSRSNQGEERVRERLVITVVKKPGQPLGLGAVDDQQLGGIVVSSLSGVAKDTALQVNDSILSVNDKRIQSLQDFREAAAKSSKLVLQVNRRSEEEEEEEEDEDEIQEEHDKITVTINKRPDQSLGMGCKEKPEAGGGVRITSLSGLAAKSNLRVGDRVMVVNGRKVKSLKDVREGVGKNSQITILVGRTAAEEKPETKKAIESQRESLEKEVSLEISASEGEPIGVFPDERLRIVRIQPGSIGSQTFKMGDVIKEVNGSPVTDKNHFFRSIQRSPRPIKVTVGRSVVREKEAVLKQLPPHLEKLIQRHSGFEYLLIPVSFDDTSGRHFGLALANCAHNKVLVTGIKEGSVSADHFKLFDRICAINGTPVTDENVAKSYICASRGNFQTVVERPMAPETRATMKREYEQWKTTRVSKHVENEMPPDIQEIVARETNRRQSGKVKPCRPALKKAGSVTRGQRTRLSWHGSHTEVQIQSDVPEGKRLRRVS